MRNVQTPHEQIQYSIILALLLKHPKTTHTDESDWSLGAFALELDTSIIAANTPCFPQGPEKSCTHLLGQNTI
jgi:hypothetical protein